MFNHSLEDVRIWTKKPVVGEILRNLLLAGEMLKFASLDVLLAGKMLKECIFGCASGWGNVKNCVSGCASGWGNVKKWNVLLAGEKLKRNNGMCFWLGKC